MHKSKGIAPIIVVLLIALGLIGGTAAGYQYREPLKKYLTGKNTEDEIAEKLAETEKGKDKFEAEGIVIDVDVASKIIVIKIKSSTDSIKELRLSEVPIMVSDTTQIVFGNKKDAKIADIPINSQVHVNGTIADGKLTATKIEIQKEDVSESKGDVAKTTFEIGGVIKEVGADGITITVKSANKTAKDQKGKDLVIKVTSQTLIRKNGVIITLSEIAINDEIKAEGKIEGTNYIASKIIVKIEEEGTELKQTSNNSSNSENSNKKEE